jgi:hypothetical protein
MNAGNSVPELICRIPSDGAMSNDRAGVVAGNSATGTVFECASRNVSVLDDTVGQMTAVRRVNEPQGMPAFSVSATMNNIESLSVPIASKKPFTMNL